MKSFSYWITFFSQPSWEIINLHDDKYIYHQEINEFFEYLKEEKHLYLDNTLYTVDLTMFDRIEYLNRHEIKYSFGFLYWFERYWPGIRAKYIQNQKLTRLIIQYRTTFKES